MKKNILTSILFGGITLLTTGCMTADMWGNVSKGQEIKNKSAAGGDTIYAFGQAKENSNQIRKNSLIMMGEKYWYVLPPQTSRKFLEILRVNLPRSYVITGRKSSTGYNILPIDIQDTKGQFTSNFCLNYSATTQNEENTLRGLNFTKSGTNTYRSCFDTQGQYYSPVKSIPTEHRFQAPVSVAISKTTSRYVVNPVGLGGAVLLTPLTLTVDAIASIIFLPMAMSINNAY